MKIMHVLWGLRYGGAETMLVDMVNKQCLCHQVEIVLVNMNYTESLLMQLDKRIHLTLIKRPLQSRNLLYIIKLNWIIMRSNADIIHVHQENIIRYLFVYKLKKNFCLTVHDIQIDKRDVQKFRYVFAITEAVKTNVKRQTGKDVPVVWNGVDTHTFRQQKTKNNKQFQMVQIGRLVHLHKGQHLSLQVLHLLLTQYHLKNVHLDIIGDGDSEPYLKQLAIDLHITDSVSFLGAQPKIYLQEHLTEYDLLVQPSLWEGFGLTIVEAMSALTPVLLSNVNGMQTISQNGKYAYTFQSENVEDYAKKLYEIIQLPAEAREKLAQESYDFAVKHFDISSTVNSYLSYYEKIIHNEYSGS